MPLLSFEKVWKIREKLAANGGCRANVCFAVDGNGSISSSEFSNEKMFVKEVAYVIGSDARLAATQYDNENHPIFHLENDMHAFINAVEITDQEGGATNIATAINWCGSQLSEVPGQPSKVVVLGDGFHNAVLDPVSAVQQLPLGTVVSIVATGIGIEQDLLDSLTENNPDLSFTVDSFNDAGTIAEIMESLIYAIC